MVGLVLLAAVVLVVLLVLLCWRCGRRVDRFAGQRGVDRFGVVLLVNGPAPSGGRHFRLQRFSVLIVLLLLLLPPPLLLLLFVCALRYVGAVCAVRGTAVAGAPPAIRRRWAERTIRRVRWVND